MHLCETCRAERDWENDEAVKAKTDRNLRETDENRKARCGGCRTYIRNPLFQLCKRCAEKGDLCQHCSKPTLTPERLAALKAAEERREELIDLFTLSVKAYGLAASRELFQGMRAVFGDPAVDMLRTLDFRDIDYGRERRPLWTKVLGVNVFRFRRCAACADAPRSSPGILKAEGCGHWTTAQSGAFCPVCAADAKVCEACGGPTDAPVD